MSVTGVFVSRLSDALPESFFAGLISIGDEILEVNGRKVNTLPLEAVYELMATGQCTPDQAASAISVVDRVATLTELDELKQRVETLEAKAHRIDVAVAGVAPWVVAVLGEPLARGRVGIDLRHGARVGRRRPERLAEQTLPNEEPAPHR